MNFNWQDTTALMVVAVAAAYLLRVARSSVVGKKASACGGCPKCASGSTSTGMTPSNERLVVLGASDLKPKPR